MKWQARAWTAGIVLVASPLTATDAPLDRLLAAYATAPQGYPTNAIYAAPDRATPFRWHVYRDDAIPWYDDVPMRTVEFPYNLLDTAVEEDFEIRATAGEKYLANPQGGLPATTAAHWAQYRWFKLNVFNPGKTDARIEVSGVPFVLHPGTNIVAVKTADAAGHERAGGGAAIFNTVPVRVVSAERGVALRVNRARMEQEVPVVLSERGKLFQFASRAEPGGALVIWPGFTPVEKDAGYTKESGFGWTAPAKKRRYVSQSFRSFESALLWSWCEDMDAGFRVDVPNGRYVVWTLATPVRGFDRAGGAKAKVNGVEMPWIPAKSREQLRRDALSGEAWDYRPGACLWEQLVRGPYYPATYPLTAEAKDGALTIEFPSRVALRALVIFPEADREAAMRELGRLNFLLAESWDVAHPWIKGALAKRERYIGTHEDGEQPGRKLIALRLTDDEFARGFVLFRRGLTEAVYADTIPTPAERTLSELRGAAAPGQTECLDFGILPLREVAGVRVAAGSLVATNGAGKIAAAAIDIRWSRLHQKTMHYGANHQNHPYNYQEHYLVRRATVDLDAASARRVYLDITVPPDTPAGCYTGAVAVAGFALPVTFDVWPFTLDAPKPYLAASFFDAKLPAYGFNTFPLGYDDAAKAGVRAYTADLRGVQALKFNGKAIAWANVLSNQELMAKIVGDEPRGFFGGLAPGTYGKANWHELGRAFFDGVTRAIPAMNILNVTLPVFCSPRGGYQDPQTWELFYTAGKPTLGKPGALEEARRAGKEFWFTDGVSHSKEQMARFTFGFWLWRLGATGRHTTLAAATHAGFGTARETYEWQPYYALADVTTCNVDRALMESRTAGEMNPSRDLVLIREGIDDLRYVETLERLITQNPTSPTTQAAKEFLDDLRQRLSFDLDLLYEMRSGAYAENWCPRPGNPWTSTAFDDTRRRIANFAIQLTVVN